MAYDWILFNNQSNDNLHPAVLIFSFVLLSCTYLWIHVDYLDRFKISYVNHCNNM